MAGKLFVVFQLTISMATAMSIIISSIAIAVNPLAHTLWHTYICVCKCALFFCFIYFLWPTAVIFCLIYLFQFFAQLNLYLQQSFIRYTRTICLTRYMAQFGLHSYSLHTSPNKNKKGCQPRGPSEIWIFVAYIWKVLFDFHSFHSPPFILFISSGDELFAMQTISASIFYVPCET